MSDLELMQAFESFIEERMATQAELKEARLWANWNEQNRIYNENNRESTRLLNELAENLKEVA